MMLKKTETIRKMQRILIRQQMVRRQTSIAQMNTSLTGGLQWT